MMTLLREALSWNYVLVTAVMQFAAGTVHQSDSEPDHPWQFIPERLWGAGGMPSSHSQRYVHCWLLPGATAAQARRSSPLRLVVSIIVMYDAMGVRRETGEQA